MSTAENMAVVRQFFEFFHNQRRLGLGARILVSELLTPTLGMAAAMRTAFPDYPMTIDDQLAEADKDATAWTASGTHQRESTRPVASTGKAVT
jgi:predicted ester cyclase